MVVGNVVRRVLGLIRDEAEDDREADFTLSETGSESQPQTPRAMDGGFTHFANRICSFQRINRWLLYRPLGVHVEPL